MMASLILKNGIMHCIIGPFVTLAHIHTHTHTHTRTHTQLHTHLNLHYALNIGLRSEGTTSDGKTTVKNGFEALSGQIARNRLDATRCKNNRESTVIKNNEEQLRTRNIQEQARAGKGVRGGSVCNNNVFWRF